MEEVVSVHAAKTANGPKTWLPSIGCFRHLHRCFVAQWYIRQTGLISKHRYANCSHDSTCASQPRSPARLPVKWRSDISRTREQSRRLSKRGKHALGNNEGAMPASRAVSATAAL